MAQKTPTRKKTLTEVKHFVKEYVGYLRAQGVPVECAYVYGSYARGTARAGSDIDLCVVSPQFSDPGKALSFLWMKRRDIDVQRDIEPVGYHPREFKVIESPLVWDIYENGLRII